MKPHTTLVFAGLWLSSATILAGAEPPVVPLWPNGAPGSESRRNEPEEAKDYWVRNVHNPSVTVYLPPKDKATGAAVVIFPGGGHRLLVFHAEAEDPARFFNSLGVAAFAVKYRLGREEGSPYSIEKHAREDGLRAMRLVRSRAREWGVDPSRIGLMGFSAGGELASMVALGGGGADLHAPDPVDRVSSRPDFLISVYPGPLGIPDALPADAPPAFLLVANDDNLEAVTAGLLQKYHDAKVSVEAHVLARGGHGFNMGDRSKLASVKGWPQRLADWMGDSGFLNASSVALTFDDLPVHAALPSGMSRSDVARSVLAALRAHHAPATYGFVNAKSVPEAADHALVLKLWREAGHPLGNHGFSHMDLSTNPAEAWEQDVTANEATLQSYMGEQDWHWLRFPYLHEGDTTEKRQAVASFLKGRGYRVAEVTLNFDDYAYNDPYARCLAKKDTVSVEWLKESFLRRAGDSITVGQQQANLAFGRDIAHVMLLHIGAFETVMLPRLLDLLAERGFRLVTLPEAARDPAYAIDPGWASASGATLLDQVLAAKKITGPRMDGGELSKLSGLCR